MTSIGRRTLLGIAALFAASAVDAQVRLEVTPAFTSYYATTHTAFRSENENERQEAGPGLSLTTDYHFTRTFGVQGTATHVWSGIIPKQLNTGSTISILNPITGRLTFVTVRGTFQPRRSNYYLALGPTYMWRSGKAWDDPAWTDLSDPGLSAGFGIRARITPEWQFNIGVDAHFYRSDPDEDGGTYYQRRLQRDVMISIGVPYALMGR